MTKINEPLDVEYLVFQGGGGKGVAYAGALKALEELGILPIRPGENNHLKGIAGTSAGAISALMLAMGYTSDEIDERFLSDPDMFTAFFDGPDNDSYRTVSAFNSPGRSERSVHINVNETFGDFLKNIRELSLQNPFLRIVGVTIIALVNKHSGFHSLLGRPAPEGLLLLFKSLDQSLKDNLGGRIVGSLGQNNVAEAIVDIYLELLKYVTFLFLYDIDEANAALNKLGEHKNQYLYNLFFDLGFFPGFTIREFFQKHITLRFKELYEGRNIQGATLNFKDFYELTGCNLIFTGVNVSKNHFQFFSKDHTPDFPVAEAAAISMNIPIVFKPIHVQRRDLEGFWIDGGTVNNLPLHAFDYLEKPELLTRYNEDLYAYLHSKVLAISLIDFLPGEKPDSKEENYFPVVDFINSLLQVMWDPNESQIKREIEREQIIQIPYGGLSTLNFSPSEELKEEPIRRAYKLVMEYFGRSNTD